MTITNDIVRTQFGDLKDEEISQWHVCSCCPYYKQGFTHYFAYGYTMRCELLNCEEMLPDTLMQYTVFCRGKEPVVDECNRCKIYERRGAKYFDCSYCKSFKKTCLWCPNLISEENFICLIHGKMENKINGEKTFPFAFYRWNAANCKDYGKYYPMPKKCETCFENENCPYAYNLEKCERDWD